MILVGGSLILLYQPIEYEIDSRSSRRRILIQSQVHVNVGKSSKEASSSHVSEVKTKFHGVTHISTPTGPNPLHN
ncbi:DNA polymerase [Bienertia sinuspersici]